MTGNCLRTLGNYPESLEIASGSPAGRLKFLQIDSRYQNYMLQRYMLQLDVHVAVGFSGLNLSLFPTYAVGLQRFLTICRSPAIIYSDFGQVAGVRRPFSAISHNFPVIRRLFSLVSGDFQVSRVCLRRFRTVCRCSEANSDHFQQLNVTVGGLQ